jgi:hypothetical protein
VILAIIALVCVNEAYPGRKPRELERENSNSYRYQYNTDDYYDNKHETGCSATSLPLVFGSLIKLLCCVTRITSNINDVGLNSV